MLDHYCTCVHIYMYSLCRELCIDLCINISIAFITCREDLSKQPHKVHPLYVPIQTHTMVHSLDQCISTSVYIQWTNVYQPVSISNGPMYIDQCLHPMGISDIAFAFVNMTCLSGLSEWVVLVSTITVI